MITCLWCHTMFSYEMVAIVSEPVLAKPWVNLIIACLYLRSNTQIKEKLINQPTPKFITMNCIWKMAVTRILHPKGWSCDYSPRFWASQLN